eukprot:4383955-Prymnesium_polylepis.1
MRCLSTREQGRRSVATQALGTIRGACAAWALSVLNDSHAARGHHPRPDGLGREAHPAESM